MTTLIVTVAVFLAYNANNGLPFVPTRVVNVQIANGAELVKGNEVRSGGYRVGVVSDMAPARLPNGKVGALLRLKLDDKFGVIPVDSRIVVRPRSSLGLKYVDLVRGRSSKALADNGTIPITQTKVPVELDEFYDMFDARTRRASQIDLEGFGDGLVGRGYDLNVTIQRAPGFFGHLERVMHNLASPRTDLKSFFKELGDAARIVAPLSEVNARLFTDMGTAFEAISRDQQALKDTITKNAPTLEAGIESLRVQRPFLAETADFSHDLRYAASDLEDALPSLNSALKVGIPVTKRSVGQYDDLQQALDAFRGLAESPTTPGSLRGLKDTVGTIQPQLRFLGPYVTVCNYWTMFWTTNAAHFGAPDGTGTAQRAQLNDGYAGDDNITTQGANEFVHGVFNPNDPRNDPSVPASNGGVPQYLHNNTVGGDAIHPDGRANCQKGQQGYAYGLNRFRPAGYDAYARAVVDQPAFDDSIDFGPTYRRLAHDGGGVGLGPRHVPAGETYTVHPGGLARLVGGSLPTGGLPNRVQRHP